jgi:general nucleoside transport system ATP-binding protein
MRGDALVEMRGIHRRFGDTHALRGVDLILRAGEIHALLGSNGAGKTTLVRILAGLDRPDEGTVSVLSQPVSRFDPKAARAAGVALVQQHFTLVPTLSASENLILARPEGWTLPRGKPARARLDALVERTGLAVRDDVPAGQLSVGEQQRLELLRALDADARVLLLDEPTAVLTDQEAEALLVVCRALAAEGRALAFITHRLAEVFSGAERVTVLAEGREVVSDEAVADHTRSDLASSMIGHASSGSFTDRSGRTGERTTGRLVVAGLRLGRLQGIDISVASGEIVGVAGVDGNGQADLEAALSARVAPESGTVSVDGVALEPGDPRGRRARGLAYIPSDRYQWGLIRAMDLSDNLELGQVPRWRARRAQRRAGSVGSLGRWDVRTTGPAARAGTLSGGNAQKLVLARELEGRPSAVLACYPTRGLDPGAADTVAARLVGCADDGAGVLWIGAELDELLAVADRIVVLAGGVVRGPFLPPYDRAAIGLAMAGER